MWIFTIYPMQILILWAPISSAFLRSFAFLFFIQSLFERRRLRPLIWVLLTLRTSHSFWTANVYFVLIISDFIENYLVTMEKENKILQQKKLKFSIHSCSSFSSSYLPQNIVDDKPSDQASRFEEEKIKNIFFHIS